MPFGKNSYRVKVPRRSGFDKSHRNSGTLTCGTITPILCDEVIPNSRVSLKLNLAAQLPPLASETYMNASLRVEAFFVPLRLLSASFEDFFCDFPRIMNVAASVNAAAQFSDVRALMPVFNFVDSTSGNGSTGVLAPGSLADYLGIRIPGASGTGNSINILAAPFVAYHLIWQEWYRNPRVQRPAFSPSLLEGVTATSPSFRAFSLPYLRLHAAVGSNPDNHLIPMESFSPSLADGTSIFELRQRNFGLDYFTGARVSAQQGTPVSVTVPDGSNSFTIAALRAANSLQQFNERNNLPSPRLVDQVSARYGANLSDGVAQRPICIGSAKYDISTRGIDQTSNAGGGTTANPFDSVAAQYGRAYGSGSDFIIDDFVANEPGYIFVNLTLVPEVTYSTGVPRMFSRYNGLGSITDMACALLQNVGDQPIYSRELSNNLAIPSNAVFGYQDRYADFMYLPNVAHGLFRDGESLQSFLLQRSFVGSAVLSSEFLQIPKNYLDQIFSVGSGVSGLSAWYDSLLEYKVSMPLAEFSIPSLQDPAYEHGQTVSLRRNGQIF